MAASEPQQFGEFAVIEKLGQGAMGAVYKARQISLNRIVALKLLPAHFAGDADFLTRFKNEAMAAAVLNHPHIVQVYAAGEDNGTHFFAMEYVEGESFGARMERKGKLDPREVIAVACHVAQALEYAWRKARVIHRDIKPDNIFLSREGTVKVGDLGLAKLLGDPRGGVTQTGAAMGTPYYVSPEQAMATGEIDFRSDMYSLGCTIYHALTGEPPYRGASAMVVMMQHISQPPPKIQIVWPACPPPIVGLLDRLLRKRAGERHESYAALLDHLFQVAERITQPAPSAEAANSFIVPKAVPRSDSTPDASSKPASANPAPRAGGRGKVLTFLGAIAATVIALLVWQPWKKQVLAPIAATNTTTSPTKADGWISLMDKIDPTADAVHGRWSRAADGLQGDHDPDSKGPGVLQPPYEPPEEYDFRISFTFNKQSDEALQFLVAAGHEFRWTTAGGTPRKAGFSRVGGKAIESSPAAVELSGALLANVRHESLVEVRRDRVTGHIDGRKMVEWKTDYSDMSNELIFDLRHANRLGIGTWQSTTFHDISVREVSGKGKLPDGIPPKPATAASTAIPVASVTPPQAPPTPPPTPAPAPAPGIATVVPKPTPDTDGFIALLDGDHFGGWQQSGTGGFTFHDGVATSWMAPKGSGLWWYSERKFSDFTMKLEFRIQTPKGNSGVFVRFTDPLMPHKDGYQIDVSEDPNPLEMTGAICGVKAPTSVPQKARDWNELEISAAGQRYLVKLNGTLVNDFTGNRQTSGYIGLQNYKVGGVQFRNIRIRDTSPPAPPKAPAPPSAATKDRPFVNTLGQEFVPVPGLRALICRWEARVQDYAAFAQARAVDDAWRRQEKDGVPVSREPADPVCGVSWQAATAFCQWLTEKETADGKLPSGARYRLPTDAEWSRAAGLSFEQGLTPLDRSAKNTVEFPWGRDFPPKDKTGNYADTAFHGKFSSVMDRWLQNYADGFATTSPVGSFAANAYGIYDLGGNVAEWCEDWVDATQKARVLRGGSWLTWDRASMLASNRPRHTPTGGDNDCGFRCVLDPVGAGKATAPAMPAIPNFPTAKTPEASAGFVPIFNGTDLTGWEGETRFWSVKDGCIAGQTTATNRPGKPSFLIWNGGAVSDFELRLSFNVIGGHSGVQYRGHVLSKGSWRVEGYLCAVPGAGLFDEPGDKFWRTTKAGEKARWLTGRRAVRTSSLSAGVPKPGWNDLAITAQGNRFTHLLNGVKVLEVTDEDTASGATSGVLALQAHMDPTDVLYKDIRLRSLAKPQ